MGIRRIQTQTPLTPYQKQEIKELFYFLSHDNVTLLLCQNPAVSIPMAKYVLETEEVENPEILDFSACASARFPVFRTRVCLIS